MKLSNNLAYTVLGLMILGYVYLLIETWIIFGFFTLLWTNLLCFFSGTILSLVSIGKKTVAGTVSYNPKELPKLLAILISLGVGIYLYTLLDKNSLGEYRYILAICYLITLTLIPSLISIYKLIRDRNDNLKITSNTISYRDNKSYNEVEIKDVKKGETFDDGYRLVLKDNTNFDIPFKKMGFNFLEISSAINAIQEAISSDD